MTRIYNAIAHVFLAYVWAADQACVIYLNIRDRGGRFARDTHLPMENEND